jgi:hypothetical protein
LNFDNVWIFAACGNSPLRSYVVIPAEAGIQRSQGFLGSRFSGSDGRLRVFRKRFKANLKDGNCQEAGSFFESGSPISIRNRESMKQPLVAQL